HRLQRCAVNGQVSARGAERGTDVLRGDNDVLRVVRVGKGLETEIAVNGEEARNVEVNGAFHRNNVIRAEAAEAHRLRTIRGRDGPGQASERGRVNTGIVHHHSQARGAHRESGNASQRIRATTGNERIFLSAGQNQ